MSEKELEALIKSSGSVAQFLADKEKCKAVWGESEPLTTNDQEPWKGRECLHCGGDPAYETTKEVREETGCRHVHYPEACKVCSRKHESYELHSVKAFVELRERGEAVAITYIKNTIL